MKRRYTAPKSLQPHVCAWCEKRFDQLRGLKRHLKQTRHDQFIGSNEEKRAKAELQSYHQDKLNKTQD